MKVGIRELKSHLSAYIDRARHGETIVITDHGKAVAQLVPTTEPEIPPTLKRLAEEGRLILKPFVKDLPPPIKMEPGGKSLAEYVAEQRR
jgi:prevent-host-death family protein